MSSDPHDMAGQDPCTPDPDRVNPVSQGRGGRGDDRKGPKSSDRASGPQRGR